MTNLQDSLSKKEENSGLFFAFFTILLMGLPMIQLQFKDN
jgi:hypothetical protein